MQRAPLAQDLAERARIGDLVLGDAGQRIAGDVADGVAAGLDAVQLHVGQQVHHIGALAQRDPVELHIGAGGEVAVAELQPRADHLAVVQRDQSQFVLCGLRVGQQLGVGLVVFARHFGQHAQLLARQLAVGHRYAQHRRVALHIPAILQAQWLEFLVTQRAGQIAFKLVAVLRGPAADELAVEFCVLVHGLLFGLGSMVGVRCAGCYSAINLKPA